MSSSGRDHTGPARFQADAAVIRRNRLLGPAALVSVALAPVAVIPEISLPDSERGVGRMLPARVSWCEAPWPMIILPELKAMTGFEKLMERIPLHEQRE